MTNQEDIRFATFNVSLNRSESGELISDLSTPDNKQAQNVAEIIQRKDPDVVLLNEFDYDSQGEGIRLFQENYLGVSQNGVDPVEYPYVYSAPSNTGIPSGFDLDNDGSTDGPGDAFGFGFYPGQFGMVLLSKYPIVEEEVRTFQNFLWKDMPGALLPDDPTTPEPNDYYSEEELEVFRLSSKSHWDIPIEVDGKIVHILASHPTPPVFDGEEDRNGRRNHDEIRFWADYISPGEGSYIYDDAGNFGGLAAGESFVIAGDLNADPFDGDSFDNAILQLLDNPLVNTTVTPDSEGGVAASIRQGGVNDTHEGNPAFDTADFNDDSGNLRVDYVLPSEDLEITDAEVFWTTPEDPLFRLIGDFDPDSEIPNGFPASDHRIVFADVRLPEADMEETNSDNNFNDAQQTEFLALAIDTEAISIISPLTETPDEIRFGNPENPDPDNAPDAEDPAIYINPDNPEQSFVIATFKDGGLRVYDLAGEEIQSITPGNVDDNSPFPSPNTVPENIRYNNVDIAYNVEYFGQLVGSSETIDFAVISDRANDTVAFFAIDPETKQLTKWDEGFEFPESIFGVDDGEATAYGLATYNSPVDGKSYVFVSQADGNQIAQLEFSATFGAADEPIVNANIVRTFEVPIPEGEDLEDAQVEGMVVDRETGILYVAQEEFGIWKYNIEPTVSANGDSPILVDTVDKIRKDSPLTADLEGLTIYYGEDGNGYLVASSQGNSTFAIYDRAGSNSYLGSFAVEGVEESDGLDVTNVPLGEDYPAGLLVVQDGSNEPAVVFADPEDGEIQNFNTNFKYVSLADFADTFPNLPPYDPNSFDPRNPETRTLINGVASGDTTQDSTVLWTRSLVLGNVTFEYATDAEFENVIGTVEAEVTDTDVPVKIAIADLESGTDYYYRVTDAAGDTEVGEFTTSTEVGTYNGFRFGATGDWQQAPPYPSLSNADERDLELFVKLGDTIYADLETPALPGVSQARELSEFRTKHSEVITDRVGLNTVSDLYADTSILATIDDHEIVDNFAGGAAPGESPDAPDVSSSDEPLFTDDVEFVNDTEVYENSLQAYQEYHPLQDRFYGDTGEERTANERQLYRYNTYGSDAAVIMLDSRSFRDDQIEPIDLTNPDDTARFFSEAFDPSRTLLGREQVEDLKADLLAADAEGIAWKFVTIPEPIQNFGTSNAEDRFEGYAAERNEILQFIDENNIDNVVFMAGDFHGTIVNNLTYQTAPGGEQIATDAFEIVTGPAAFDDGLFGPMVANLSAAAGLITPEQKALYDSLPVDNDTDSEVDDRDDFIKNLLQEQTNLFGYDPVGLDNNLDVADGAVDAELIQGDYVATHTFGWTEFDVDAETQQLRVTTYGVEPYSEEELLADPNAITQLEPVVVSEFLVNPQGVEPDAELTPVFGTLEADIIDVAGTELVFAGEGDDTVNVAEEDNRTDKPHNDIYGDAGDDTFFLGTGVYVVGGEGSDQFWVADGKLPDTPVRIADFTFDSDVVGFSNLGISSDDLTITPHGDDVLIAIAGTEVAILSGVDANASFDNSFAFA